MKLLTYPQHEKFLRTPGKELTLEDLKSEEFLLQAEEFKKLALKDGVGLAGPQAGWGVKLFVVCVDPQDNLIDPKFYINPVIIESSKKKTKHPEGCLSFPNLFLNIRRSNTVTISYLDLEGVSHTETHEGFYAKVMQHETDHVNGKLFIDSASSVQQLQIDRWKKSIIFKK